MVDPEDPAKDETTDLPDRVDDALEALWQGDPSEFERLLDAEGEGNLDIGEVLQGLTGAYVERLARPGGPLECGGYKILSEIGRGGMGIVYEAEQQSPRRRVALKVLRATETDEHRVKLFRREVQTLARLQHPDIATIHEAGQTREGQHFFTMELVDGVPLTAFVRDRNLARPDRLDLFARICDAVQYAHEHGVVHRDLKPSNILVDAEGNLKVVDFGLARITDPGATLTATAHAGSIVGTPAYMSPEQARGLAHEIDARGDVYSLGVILFELLTGEPPYRLTDFSPPEAVRIICEEAPPRPSTIDRTLRGELDTIVLKALEKEPERRFASVRDLAEDVRRFLRREPILARPPSLLYRARKMLSKHRVWVAVAAAALALAAVGIWGGTWWRDRAHERQRVRDLASARGTVVRIQQALDSQESQYYIEEAFSLYKRTGLTEAHLAWAKATYRRGLKEGEDQLNRAFDAIKKARAPNRWAYDALLSEMYAAIGNPEQAEKIRAQAEREAPDTAEGWYLRSYATMDPANARRCVERSLELDPTNRLAQSRLVYIHLAAGEFEEALERTEELIRVGFSTGHWLSVRASTLVRLGRYREAIESTRAAEFPKQRSTYRTRAVAELCLGEYELAVESYSKAVALALAKDPTYANWIRYQRATPLWILGRNEEAATDYREFRAREGISSFGDARWFLVLRDQASRLGEEGREDEAREVLAEADEVMQRALLSPMTPWAGEILRCLNGKLTPDALVDAADPDNPEHRCEAAYYAGEACLLQDRVVEARGWFQKCVETGVDFDQNRLADPMNEFHLARWRLRQLGVEDGTPGRGDTPDDR